MPEYIEREALKKSFCEWCNKEYENEPCEPDECPLRTMIIEAPTADVAEVVRCKDCIYYRKMATGGLCMCGDKKTSYAADFYPKENDFCSYGERKTDQ